ncbi:hypothetical protein E5D57_006612 [Metarhizium anisopliae]|nr:hypothetical protein E5D57_006612 [Metarhizium anisopliae]
MAQDQGKLSSVTEPVDDDEPDEWDKRIFSTGCADVPPLRWRHSSNAGSVMETTSAHQAKMRDFEAALCK